MAVFYVMMAMKTRLSFLSLALLGQHDVSTACKRKSCDYHTYSVEVRVENMALPAIRILQKFHSNNLLLSFMLQRCSEAIEHHIDPTKADERGVL